MERFYDSLNESKNTHIRHIEEIVLDDGTEGIKDAINLLYSTFEMLSGNSTKSFNITTKWDGSPSVITGTNPDNGQFFVGTKSVFNKSPKINYSFEDIEINHNDIDLQRKLKIAFHYFQKLDFQGIIQGDILYTSDDLYIREIDGEQHLIFQPNTILYSIPFHSDLAQRIFITEMGVVFHTYYTGSTFSELKSHPIPFHIEEIPELWIPSNEFKDEAGSCTLTKDETKKIKSLFRQVETKLNRIDTKIIDILRDDSEIVQLIKMFNNSKVRKGLEPIWNVKRHVDELLQFIHYRYSMNIDSLKTVGGRNRRMEKCVYLQSIILQNKKQMIYLFELQKLLTQIKLMLIRKMDQVRNVGTFMETSNGLKVTSPEGYVISDHIGNSVKLVDRLEFSYYNFNIPKKWS